MKHSLFVALILIICLSLSAVSAVDMDNSLSDNPSSDLILSSNDDVTISDLSESIDGNTVGLDSSIGNNDVCTDSATDVETDQAAFNESDDEISYDDVSNNLKASNALTDSATVDIYVSDSAGNDETGDGTAGSPYKTVYKALEGISAYSNDVINIHIASGTYTVNNNMLFSSGNTVNLIGDEYNKTFFDAEENGYYFSINANNEVSFVNISFINFYLQNYYMFQNNGNLLLDNCIVLNNNYSSTRTYSNPVILNAKNLSIKDSKFRGNKEKTAGVLIYNSNAQGTIYIDNSEFSDYYFGIEWGGNYFIYIDNGKELNITNSKFTYFYSPNGLQSNNDYRLIYNRNSNITFNKNTVSNMEISYIIYSTGGDISVLGNDITNISSNNYLIYNQVNRNNGNKDYYICNNSFNNIYNGTTRGYYIIYLDSSTYSGQDYNFYIHNNSFSNVLFSNDTTSTIYSIIRLTSGNNSLVDNKFEEINFPAGRYAPLYLIGINGKGNTYLKNNVMGEVGDYTPIFLASNHKANLNVTCLNESITHGGYYEIKVTDDMGNAITTGNSPFMELYFDGELVGSSNITDGIAYIKFSSSLENREYVATANADFLSEDSTIVGANVLVNITHNNVDLYVSDNDGNDETGDGSNENPYKSLKKAIENVGPQDIVTIHIASGTYSGEDNCNITALLDNLVWGGNIIIVGEDLENTIFDNTTFLLDKYTKLSLNNISFSSFSSRANSWMSTYEKLAGTVTLENCKFDFASIDSLNITLINSSGCVNYINSNYTYIFDSAIYYGKNAISSTWITSNLLLLIDNSSVSNVTAQSWRPNVLYSNNIFLFDSEFSQFVTESNSITGANITIENCTFSNNRIATTNSYYMIYATESLDFINSTVSKCDSLSGGRGLISANSINNFRVLDSKFIECENIPSINTVGGNLLVNNCTFENCINENPVAFGQGIMYISSNATISNCTFINSSDTSNGVIVLSLNNGKYVNIENNVFNNSYNTEGSYGGSFCIQQLDGNSFLENNTIVAEEDTVCILNIVEHPSSSNFIQTNAYVTFINETINSLNTVLYINVTDDMGNPITYRTGSNIQNRNVSFILSEELIGYSPVVNGVASLGLPSILANGEYEFTGFIPFASDESNIQFTTILVDFNLDTTKVYVATDGSDENGDGTLENPFKTINKAIEYGFAQTLNVEVYIKEGVYSGLGNTNLTIDNLGYLSLIGYDGFNKTIIDGDNVNKFLDITSLSNVKLSNLSFVNANVGNVTNFAAIYSLGELTVDNCVFENLSGNDSAVMIYTNGDMDLLNNVFINREGFNNPAIYINGSESYLKNNTMVNFESNNGSIIVKSGLINAIVTYLDNSTFTISGPKVYLKATVTDDMGNSISGGTLSFLLNETNYGNMNLTRGVSALNIANTLNNGEYSVYGNYSFASQDSIIKSAYVNVFDMVYDPFNVYVSVDGSDLTGDGTESNPFKTINAAINYGFAKSYDVIVLIKEGVYSGLGNTNYTLDFAGDLTLIGVDGYNKTIVDACASKFFTIGMDNNVNLINLTFVNSSYQSYDYTLAPIFNEGNLNISDCIFENHVRDRYGIIYSIGNLFMNNTLFNNITSSSGSYYSWSQGGVIYVEWWDEEPTASIYNSKFYNINNIYQGGAIFMYDPSTAEISNCEFINCSAAQYGGAIYVSGSSQDVKVTDNYFNNCTAPNGEAIYVGNYVYLENNTMIDCNKTTTPIYAQYTNAYLYFEDVYTDLRTGFNLTAYLTDDKGNKISTANYNIKLSMTVGDQTVVSSATFNNGTYTYLFNTITENGEYVISGNITQMGLYYDITIRNGTLIVNRTIESPITVYVNQNNGDDSGVGSQQVPFKTVSKAIEYAISESNYPTIIISNGIYSGENYTNLSFENVKNLTLIGSNTVFDGEESNWLFKFNNIENLNIANISFINAKSDDLGSAIFINNTGFATIYNCEFINNSAKEGGSIYIEGDGSLNHLKFANNSAETGGSISFKGNVVINNTIFENSVANTAKVIYYAGNYAGETNFWGKNYLSSEEFINANLLVKETGGIAESIAPENWVIVNSNFKNATYLNIAKYYDVFFSHYDDDTVVNTLKQYILVAESSLGHIQSSTIRLTENNGLSNLYYNPVNMGVDTLTISNDESVLIHKDITIRELQTFDEVYISADGDDDLGNGTYEAPFKSFDMAFRCINVNGKLFINGAYNVSTLNINKNLTLSSYDGDAILDGLSRYQIMSIGNNVNVTLNGLTFVNAGSNGAIVQSRNGFLTINDCKFINNSGSGYAVRLRDCVVENSSFINTCGMIYLEGDSSFKNTSFINHTDVSMLLYLTKDVSFEDCKFINNTYNRAIVSEYSLIDIIASDSIFENNHATGNGGLFEGSYNLELENCKFINNSASNNGGVLYDTNGEISIIDCIFANNSAGKLGGVMYLDSTSLYVEKSIFDGNDASNGSVIATNDEFSADNNYWAKNYDDADEFIADGLITNFENWNNYVNVAPETWINLNVNSDENMDKGTSKEYTVSLNTLNDGTVWEDEYLPDYTVFITDTLGNVVPCEVLITEGVGTFTYDGSNAGKDTISVYSTLVPDHLLLTKDISVTIPATTVLTVPETSIFGEEIPISIKVEAIDGSTVEGSIALYVNGEKVTDLTLVNGMVNYSLTVESTGTYEIAAVLDSDCYASDDAVSTVTVNKKSTAISIDTAYAMVGDDVVSNIKLSDIDGNPLSGDVSITLPDGTVVNMTIEGMASCDFGTFTEAGNYSVFAEYAGDENYEGASATGVIVVYGEGNVLVKHTEAGDAADIQAAIDAANPGDIIRLGDYDYTDVSGIVINKDITISAEGASICSTGDGTPIFNVPAISEGGAESANITGVDFKLSNGDTVVKVTAENNTEDPLSIVTPSIGISGNTFDLADENVVAESVTVLELESDRGVLSPTGDIVINDNTIAAGVDPFDFKVTSIGSDGEVNIVPHSIVPEKKATVIHYADMNTTTVDQSVDGRAGKYFNFQLTDTEGNPIVGVPMQIGFLGVIYDESNGVITNETGGARLQINLGYKNDYTFAICFLGNDEYNASFVIAKIIVTPQKGSLTVPNKSYSASAKTKTLTATFKSASGKPVAGKTIKFTVNGKTYSAKTNDKGVASVNVSLNKKGTYSFTAKFTTNGMYETMTKTAKLTIK